MSKNPQSKKVADPAFFKAAAKGDAGKLKAMLSASHAPDLRDSNGRTALMRAAEHGQVEAVRTLLNAGASAALAVSDRDSVWLGCNALIFAAQSGSPEIVHLLLAAGASPKCEAADGTTPLSFAVEHRSAPMVKDLLKAGAPLAKDILVNSVWNSSLEVSLLLIEAGADVNACNDLRQSVLHRAAELGQLELLQALIKAKAKLNPKANGTTPLLEAISNKHAECAIELIQAGADLSGTTLGRRNALMLAAFTGQAQVVATLLKAGIDPNARDAEGKTALMLANEKEHADVTKLLRGGGSDESGYQVQEYLRAAAAGDVKRVRHFLEAGVDVNVVYQNGTKALISAVMKGHVEVVRLLLEWGANASTAGTAKAWGGKFHADALALAADEGNLEIVRLLLKSGADANKSHMFWKNALDTAATRGHTEIVRELIKAGHTVRGQVGAEALDHAIDRKHEETALALMEAGVKVTGKSGAGLLVTAAEKGMAGVVKALLAAGIDPKLRNEYDQTPLQAAEAAGRKAIAAILRKAKSPQASVNLELVEAAERGDWKTVHRLILEGVDVESRDAKGATALIRASANRHVSVMQELLKAGANPNAATEVKKRDRKELFHHMDLTFETPLSCALDSRCLPAVEMLLQAGADIKKTECGHVACMILQERTEAGAALVERLIDAGMDPNAYWPVINVSALEIAAQQGFPRIVKKLIDRGARLKTSEQRNRAILDAVQRGRLEIARMLIERGIAPQVKGVICAEALAQSAMDGHDEMVILLVKRGVGVNQRADLSFENEGTVEGITPLIAAARHGRISTVQTLLALGANPNTKDRLLRTAFDWVQDNKSKSVVQKILQLLEKAAGK